MSVNNVNNSTYSLINSYQKDKTSSAGSTSSTSDKSKVDSYTTSKEALAQLYSAQSVSLADYLNYDSNGKYSSSDITDLFNDNSTGSDSLQSMLDAIGEDAAISESELKALLGSADDTDASAALADLLSSTGSTDNDFNSYIESVTTAITVKNNELIKQAFEKKIKG